MMAYVLDRGDNFCRKGYHWLVKGICSKCGYREDGSVPTPDPKGKKRRGRPKKNG